MNCCICQFSVRVPKDIHTDTVGHPPVLISELVLQCTRGTNYVLTEESSTICKKCCEKLARYHKSIQLARTLREEILECDVCSKRFVHKVALYKHKMIHDSETKRLECQVCGFKTRTKAHLERHMRSHTGDKPFACPVCNKRFSQMYNMKAHLREHESPGTNRHRRFHCSKCTHTFINEQNYEAHVQRDDCTAV
ncbi:GM12190 [Drosophila sechellia]|uniref:GM12190 n=1 Tax=Drosophila sechellia TaxID=7238 RepID=B4HZK4_DROSE|nr:GM12190 [Drosophila sechellia]